MPLSPRRSPATDPAVPSDDEALGDLVGRSVARLAKQVERALAGSDLSLPQYRTLTVMAKGATMSSTLALDLAVKPPTVTSVVDGLVGRGLVERRSDPTDRRRLPLALTDEGLRVLQAANLAIGERMRAVLDGLDDGAATGVAADGLRNWVTALDVDLERRHREKPE